MSIVSTRSALEAAAPLPVRPMRSVALVPLAAALVLIALLIFGALTENGNGWRHAALVIIAALIGLSLQRASFGFSSAFRLLVEEHNAYGLRIHAVLLIIASLLIMPLLSVGSIGGMPLSGFGSGIGPAFAAGALMFGAGMQISGGCASGTLFALGGGNLKPLATLLGFVLGSTAAAASIGFWWALPALPPVFLQEALGLPIGLGMQIGALLLVLKLARRRSSRPDFDRAGDGLPAVERLLYGRWPLLWGAVALALLNALTLVLSGQPWGETSAFALWGGQVLDAAGFGSVRGWAYWSVDPGALDRPLLADIPSLMDAAIVLGAMAGAASGGLFDLRSGGSGRAWLGALIGGILMGYGARLSGGCNIGAYFSAGASGSLSAWAWVGFALIGSAAGLRFRPLFALEPRPAPVAGPGC